MTNEGGSKMVLIICANRLDVDIDRVAEIKISLKIFYTIIQNNYQQFII
jgi:hypothetical protein